MELTGQAESDRFRTVASYITRLFKAFNPGEVAIEKLIWGKNRNNLLQISEFRGLIKLCAYEHGANIFEYFPTEIKSSLSGYGRESKNELMHMLQLEGNFSFVPLYDDASDAMAVAWIHSVMRNGNVIES
jgi:crossover junction endodeoxyribonuclease RuvC